MIWRGRWLEAAVSDEVRIDSRVKTVEVSGRTSVSLSVMVKLHSDERILLQSNFADCSSREVVDGVVDVVVHVVIVPVGA